MERWDTPREWKLREIRSIRLLKSANVLKCHNRAYTEQPGDILFLLSVGMDYKIQSTNRRVADILHLRHSNILVCVKILLQKSIPEYIHLDINMW